MHSCERCSIWSFDCVATDTVLLGITRDYLSEQSGKWPNSLAICLIIQTICLDKVMCMGTMLIIHCLTWVMVTTSLDTVAGLFYHLPILPWTWELYIRSLVMTRHLVRTKMISNREPCTHASLSSTAVEWARGWTTPTSLATVWYLSPAVTSLKLVSQNVIPSTRMSIKTTWMNTRFSTRYCTCTCWWYMC